VNFPTRQQSGSATAIDNIFIDASLQENYIIYPLINWFSDHDAQLIALSEVKAFTKNFNVREKIIRKTDQATELSFETWDSVFVAKDVKTMYNSFLNTLLRIFYSSFPLKDLTIKCNNNSWITPGISISCKHERDLYLLYRKSNYEALKNYYRPYCNILKDVIREAKKEAL
jgi:hypothetical protein